MSYFYNKVDVLKLMILLHHVL